MSKGRKERIGEVAGVFFKYGLKKGLKGSLDPANIRLAFEELGPTFVKIGQLLSTRSDIIPPEYVQELKKLQDNVKPERYEIIKAVIEDSLHCPLEEVFLEFEEEAAASASIAEVHRARLLGGERVVVKVQRPHARETILNDIAIIRRLCRLYAFLPLPSFINLRDTLDALEENVKLELDFLNEAGNIKRFEENNRDVRFIASPRVFERHSTSTVLVMQYIEGIKIDDVAALDREGYDRHDIGVKLADNYLKQILEDGFFHADPHPGNIIISGNRIAYIDFGLMGVVEKDMPAHLGRVLHGLAFRNIDESADAILHICGRRGQVDAGRLAAEIDEVYGKYIAKPLDQLSVAEVLRDIFKVCVDHNLVIPKDVALIGKGLTTIESLLSQLSPDINILNILVDYEARRSAGSKDARLAVSQLARDLYLSASAAAKLPDKLLRLIDAAQAGKLTVKMEDTKRDRNIESINRMVNRIVFGLVVAALIVGSAIIINAGAGPKVFGLSAIGVAGYVGAAVLGFWLIISIIRSNKM